MLSQTPNRRLLLDRLQRALAQGQRTHQYGALLFIDLDNFKLLNDTWATTWAMRCSKRWPSA